MKPTIYKSTDASAPQISAAAGSMNTVLKGCLVTGYGTKAAAGWEVAHEDLATHALAIRSTNPKSIKSVLMLSDTTSASVAVTAYIDWDVSSNVGLNNFGVGTFPKILNNNTNPTWIIIASSSFFYIWVQHGIGLNYGIISGFGDVLPIGLNEDMSALLTKPAGNGMGEFILDVSNGKKGWISKNPMGTSSDGFGDSNANGGVVDGYKYYSDIAIFSGCVIYTITNNNRQPAFELQGLLMPHYQKEYKATDPIVFELANQIPYVNPLIALHQPFQGNFWLHTDDWGL